LEHVVLIDEGRHRQMNVKSAIPALLDEQARQTMYRKVSISSISSSNTTNPEEKLRNPSLHHTQWTRDLALAAGVFPTQMPPKVVLLKIDDRVSFIYSNWHKQILRHP
jgi:hypothetical protein